jgi:hypothetical protein
MRSADRCGHVHIQQSRVVGEALVTLALPRSIVVAVDLGIVAVALACYFSVMRTSIAAIRVNASLPRRCPGSSEEALQPPVRDTRSSV